MNLLDSARFALQGVLANKLRSALTTLGILIGVAAVIVLVAVGNGSGRAVQDSIGGLGADTLTVSASQGGTGGRGAGAGAGRFGGPGAAAAAGSGVSSGTQTRLAAVTLSDAEALNVRADVPDVVAVAPIVSVASVTATFSGATHAVGSFTGTSPSYLTTDDDTVQVGSAFTDADYTARRRVALLGPTTATALFGGTGRTGIGKTVQFNGVQFTVVGILGAKGSSSSSTADDRVLAPLPAVQDTLAGYGDLTSISVQAGSAASVTVATSEIESVLNARHRVTTTTADYAVSNSTSVLAAATASTKTFTVLLAAVAAISLLVGGIGVMNIMLVSVTERTREIGVRKAIGASRGSIVGQFLLEAVLLSVLGGLAGVLVGIVGARFTIVGIVPVVAPSSVVLAFCVAVAIGLFFGLYPANRAAALRPIDALRYE